MLICISILDINEKKHSSGRINLRKINPSENKIQVKLERELTSSLGFYRMY